MHFLSMATWDDVMLVVNKIDSELMIIAAAFVIALIATFAVIALQKPLKKLIRGTAWIAFALALILALNLMVSGPLYSLVNMALKEPATTNTGDGETKELALSETSLAYASSSIEDITKEGYVLLKNDGILPLASGTKVNTFGWSSTNALYGGVGSGALSPNYEIVTYLDSLTEAGLVYNTTITDFYSAWRAERPYVGMWSQDWTSPEPTQDEYNAAGIYENAVAFSDTVLFLIARNGGEGADLPTVMDDPLVEGSSGNAGDSEYPEDLGENIHYLELTTREKATLDVLNEKFENIIVIINAAPAMELGFVEEYDHIKACVLAPAGGNTGMRALGQLLTGQVNFSGRTVDTYLYDLTTAPTWNNFGHFEYTNMSEFVGDSITTAGTSNSTTPTFVNYVEGIYVGYRWWETAHDVGFLNYYDYVQYPFGYGLSYTTFTQTLDSVTVSGETVTATVTVTNTGAVSGKEVVQLYYNPPYTNGGLEKATANLVAFGKTAELAAGASETLELTWTLDDMASYDSTAKNGEGAWILEAGEYKVSLRSNSHEIIAEKSLNLSAKTDKTSDVVKASNHFGYAANSSELTYLSRKDNFANYDVATAAPTSYVMSDTYKAGFYNWTNYDPLEHNDPNDEIPTTGAKNNITVSDMRGLDYDDLLWDSFLDQLTVDEMVQLIAEGGYKNIEVRSIGKTTQTDLDGPASLNNTGTGVASMGYPVCMVIACTWNPACAYNYGYGIGMMAEDIDCSGWYAPAMNIHRTAFSGRNFEYWSEDPLLTGKMAAQAVMGAEYHGVYSFIKHFALNDQETNRCNMICTWFTEQSAREIFMRSFEIAVKEGGADAVMSSFNYLGNVYAGASPELLNNVLRDEWGFRGMVLTDYFGGYGYQDADIQIRNGGDICLSPMGGSTAVLDDQTSATAVKYMRLACKNIIYTACNSRAYATDVVVTTPTWQITIWAVSAVLALCLVALEVKVILNYKKRVTEAKAA